MNTSKESIFNLPGVPVIPVNCVGVTGAGLAKAWADKEPFYARMYRAQCSAGYLFPGDTIGCGSVTLAATKNHWRDPSKEEWVVRCIERLAAWARLNSEVNLNVPALGCGCGGLRMEVFMKAATFHFSNLRNVTVCIP